MDVKRITFFLHPLVLIPNLVYLFIFSLFSFLFYLTSIHPRAEANNLFSFFPHSSLYPTEP